MGGYARSVHAVRVFFFFAFGAVISAWRFFSSSDSSMASMEGYGVRLHERVSVGPRGSRGEAVGRSRAEPKVNPPAMRKSDEPAGPPGPKQRREVPRRSTHCRWTRRRSADCRFALAAAGSAASATLHPLRGWPPGRNACQRYKLDRDSLASRTSTLAACRSPQRAGAQPQRQSRSRGSGSSCATRTT